MYPHPRNEGSGAFVMQQVEQLRALGHQVEVLHVLGYRSRFEYLKACLEVFQRTRRQHYDVVHAHYGVTGLPALFRGTTPLVISLHGSDALVGWVEPAVSRFVCRLADATIVVSKKISRRIPGDIIPCGVDLSLFSPKPKLEARCRLNLQADCQYVLFPFNPARRLKRFDLALAAAKQLRVEVVDVELLTVSQVHYTEMPWYYSAANAMILCSDSEGSPTAIKEALACNLPIVSTDVGDVVDVTRGIEGIEIVEADAVSLAAALRRVLNRPADISFNGRVAMQRFDQRRTVESVVGVYRRVIERRRAQTAPK